MSVDTAHVAEELGATRSVADDVIVLNIGKIQPGSTGRIAGEGFNVLVEIIEVVDNPDPNKPPSISMRISFLKSEVHKATKGLRNRDPYGYRGILGG